MEDRVPAGNHGREGPIGAAGGSEGTGPGNDQIGGGLSRLQVEGALHGLEVFVGPRVNPLSTPLRWRQKEWHKGNEEEEGANRVHASETINGSRLLMP